MFDSVQFAHLHSHAMVLLQAALECAIDYAGKRESFGVPIGKLQAIQVPIINCHTLPAESLTTLHINQQIVAYKKCKQNQYYLKQRLIEH